jgi:hemerythrin-like domain-containing protein
MIMLRRSEKAGGRIALKRGLSATVEPMPFSLLDEPLNYIFADHFRQRTVCQILRRFADQKRATRAEADSVAAFFKEDLAAHYRDEEEDLFPLVRRRALPADDLGPVLACLGEDTRRSEDMIGEIVAALTGKPADDPVVLDKASCELMQIYATAEHRHLAIENGVVLAIARVRLKRSDLEKMSANMKARRGVSH